MGYTHYWSTERPFTTAEWGKIQAAARTLLKADYRMGREYLGLKPEYIKLHDSKRTYETFVLDRGPVNNFCKTGRYPYDRFVVGVLTYARFVAPDAITLSTDGEISSDIRGAMSLVSELTGATPDNLAALWQE